MGADGWREFRAGAAAMGPMALAAAPFGLLMGALAVQKGLSPLEAWLMSALVFAGSAQFVALEIWREPVSWVALGLTALSVNLRHVMMGASLAPKLERFPAGMKWPAMFFLVDEVWAMAERRAAGGILPPAFYAGLGVTLYLNWQLWTVLGAALGTALGGVERFGFDFAFTALFIAIIAGFWRGSGTFFIIAASAAAATLAKLALGGTWFILAGGLAGAAAAALGHRPEPKAPEKGR